MNINQTVALNLSEAIAPPTLRMAQDDANTRTIKASLWDGAQPFSIPSECVCMVRFGKPDGTGGLYDTTESGQKISYSGNVVTAPVAAQMLTVAGVVKAQIDIYGGGKEQQAEKLATFRFRVEVEPSAYADAKIISSDYYNVLSSQIAAAVEAGAKADAAIAAAETAQNAATAAVNAKTAAESAKTAAENAKTTAVNSANTANGAKTAAESAKADAVSAKNAAVGSATAAAGSASSAEEDAQSAAQDAEDAEAWAVGKRNGADVPSTDPTYHNNAKYYKDQAQAVVGDKVDSFNGRTGAVVPQAGDYTAEMVGAQPLLTPGDNISITGNTIATKAFPCNPNLLDNWYFSNPVNQRGQTSYTGAGYGIDRWKNTQAEVTTTVNPSGYLSVVRTTGQWNSFIQIVDNWKALAGKTVTISVLLADAYTAADTASIRLTDISTETNYGDVNLRGGGRLCSKTISVPEDVSSIAYSVYVGRSALNIIAVKLELGSQQTLAHQDANGNWELNEIPNYGEQLRRCQRYLIPINNWTRVRASYYSGTALFFAMPIPSTMRTTPAILDSSAALVVQSVSGTDQTGFTFECNMSTPGSISVRAMKSSHGLTDGQLVKRGGGSFQAVFFSSEL